MADLQETSGQVRLFILRLWLEDIGDGRAEWRGRLQAIPGGDANYFRTWGELIDYLRAGLAGNDALAF